MVRGDTNHGIGTSLLRLVSARILCISLQDSPFYEERNIKTASPAAEH